MRFARSSYLARLWQLKDTDFIKVVTGVRRCGKSTLLKLYAEELLREGVDPSRIIQIDFDDKHNESLLSEDAFYDYVMNSITDDFRHYLFFDEIQMVDDFNKTLDSLMLLENTDIYVTGSNSRLLSSEIGTLLTGRHLDIQLWPLSFAEFYEVDGSARSKQESFARYLKFGGFPGAYELLERDDALVRTYINILLKDIVEKDIVVRKRIENPAAFSKLVAFLGDCIGSPVSSLTIANVFASERVKVSHNTILNYLRYLNECYLYSKCSRFELAGKEILRTNYKEYAIDPALVTALSQQNNIGYRLENIVYNELRVRGFEVYTGKHYKGEVDFVAVQGGERIYVQVCYLLADESIIEREFGAFAPIKDAYSRIVLSMDTFDMSREGIRHRNLIDWLLDI
jgi:predicted AAA+ superfamily ATPase